MVSQRQCRQQQGPGRGQAQVLQVASTLTLGMVYFQGTCSQRFP